jgi:hypothetical protein
MRFTFRQILLQNAIFKTYCTSEVANNNNNNNNNLIGHTSARLGCVRLQNLLICALQCREVKVCNMRGQR